MMSTGALMDRGDERLWPRDVDLKIIPQCPDRLECPVCLLVLRDPIQTKCGHRFCRVCVQRIVSSDAVAINYFRCPLDKRVLSKEDDIWPDAASQREIQNLKTFCPRTILGCRWTGAVGDLFASHFRSSCHFDVLECPLKCIDVKRTTKVKVRGGKALTLKSNDTHDGIFLFDHRPNCFSDASATNEANAATATVDGSPSVASGNDSAVNDVINNDAAAEVSPANAGTTDTTAAEATTANVPHVNDVASNDATTIVVVVPRTSSNSVIAGSAVHGTVSVYADDFIIHLTTNNPPSVMPSTADAEAPVASGAINVASSELSSSNAATTNASSNSAATNRSPTSENSRKRIYTRLYRFSLREHLERSCTNRVIECDQCGQEGITASRLDKHRYRDCPQTVVKCPICWQRVTFAEASMHYDPTNEDPKTSCPIKVRKCPYAKMGCTFQQRETDDVIHLKTHMNNHVWLHAGMAFAHQRSSHSEIESLRAQLERERASAAELTLARNELTQLRASGEMETAETNRMKEEIWRMKTHMETMKRELEMARNQLAVENIEDQNAERESEEGATSEVPTTMAAAAAT